MSVLNVTRLALALVMCAAGALGGSPPFSTQPWNIKGDTLILDVGSLSFQGNHPIAPPLNEQGCADACLRTPGCNAYTFCSSKAGCGSGCRAYSEKNPALRVAANPTLPNPDWSKLPAVLGFGPWGLTSGCSSDAYPTGMCTLKRVADPAAPGYWSKEAGEGWVSGVWSPPAACAGLPGRACLRCQQSQSPQACLACAANPSFKVSMLEGALTAAPSKAEGCATCYSSSKPDACVACLSSNAPCASCALQLPSSSGRTLDVASCIDCSNKLGSKYVQSCLSCATLGTQQPQQVSQCLSCLDRMSKVACDSTGYQAGCWNPATKAASCATCAGRAASYDTCLACLLAKPFSESCESCTTLADGPKQAQCYKCSSAAAHPGSGCADCLSYLGDAGQVQQCLDCLQSPQTTPAGKQWCFGCQNWCKDSQGRAQCVACLGTKQDIYNQACACK